MLIPYGYGLRQYLRAYCTETEALTLPYLTVPYRTVPSSYGGKSNSSTGCCRSSLGIKRDQGLVPGDPALPIRDYSSDSNKAACMGTNQDLRTWK
jgi:hypothetical protein